MLHALGFQEREKISWEIVANMQLKYMTKCYIEITQYIYVLGKVPIAIKDIMKHNMIALSMLWY